VYEKAKEVVVWLGEETNLTGAAIEALKLLGDHGNGARTSEQRKLSASESRGCSQLLTHPWWKRVWIIQEISLSRNVNVQCGGYNFKWTVIGDFARGSKTNVEGFFDIAMNVTDGL